MNRSTALHLLLPFVLIGGNAGAQTPGAVPMTLPTVRTVSGSIWQCRVDDALRERHGRDAAICDADFSAAALRAAAGAGILPTADRDCVPLLAANIERSVGLLAIGDSAGARLLEHTPCGSRLLTRDSVGADPAALIASCPGAIWSWAARPSRCPAIPLTLDPGRTPAALSSNKRAHADDEHARGDFMNAEYTRTIAAARAALAVDPLDGYAHVIGGAAELALGHLDSAVAELRLGLHSRPGDSWARERLSEALLEAHRDSDAALAADSTLITDGASGAAYRVLGLARARLGHTDQAIAALQMATALAPTDAAPRIALALVYDGAHRWGDAEAAARSALGLRDDEQAHFLLATALLGLGRSNDARRELKRTIKMASWDWDARELLDSLDQTGSGH